MVPTIAAVAGPYASGPPAEALVVEIPSLEARGLAEIWRSVIIYAAFIVHVTVALLVWLRHRRGLSWQTAVSHGAVRAFEYLGPTFVKIGQLIASSPGLFPRPLADACLRCLDDVPHFSAKQVHKILAADLGRPTSELFAEFDDEPLSAASIAQVHACVLHDGREAVLKVQRPDIRNRMTVDLRIAYRLARILERHFAVFVIANATGVIEDLHANTFAELNSALEAHRQERFRESIGAFGDNKWVTAPAVYWDYCGPRVICMERMHGIPLDDFEGLRNSGADGELTLRRAVKAWIEAIAVHGPFHGDVHAGNIWLLDDGRIAFLDFGIVGELTAPWRAFLRDIFYSTTVNEDYAAIARDLRELGILSTEASDDENVAVALQLLVGPTINSDLSQLGLGQMLKSVMQLGREHAGTNPPEMILAAKQLAYFERYAKELAPNWILGKDLFLLRNVFPEEIARRAAELDFLLPAD